MTRTLVLGLDGTTFRVLDPLMDQGHLPNLAALADDGARGVLESAMPPVTGPAWLSLATGQSPGSTGVYDFIRRDPAADGFDVRYIDSGEYRGRAVWDRLGAAGERVAVVDYPTLNPPYEIPGVMVSGGLGSSETRTHPESLAADLAAYDVSGHIDIGDERYADLDTFSEDIHANMTQRADRLFAVLADTDWTFAWGVIQEPDWVQHLMWKCFDDDHPAAADVTDHERELFVDFWRAVDDVVGRAREAAGDGNLVVQSDHGFGPMQNRSLRLNTWLANEGYLTKKTGGESQYRLKKRVWRLLSRVADAVALQERAPALFRWGKNELSTFAIELNSIDTAESDLFDPGHIQSMGGLYLNDDLRGTAAGEDLLAEVRELLHALAEREGLDLETYSPEELYGQTTPHSPSLLVRVDGVNIENGGWDEPVVDSRPARLSHQNGSHRKDGVFLAAGPDVADATVEGARIWDLAPTLLHLYGQPVPSVMDGSVLTDALATDRAVETVAAAEAGEPGSRLDDAETEAMEEQLRDLGYFE